MFVLPIRGLSNMFDSDAATNGMMIRHTEFRDPIKNDVSSIVTILTGFRFAAVKEAGKMEKSPYTCFNLNKLKDESLMPEYVEGFK